MLVNKVIRVERDSIPMYLRPLEGFIYTGLATRRFAEIYQIRYVATGLVIVTSAQSVLAPLPYGTAGSTGFHDILTLPLETACANKT